MHFLPPKRNRTPFPPKNRGVRPSDRANEFVSFPYLLQVTLPELEFSDQSFLVSLQSWVMPLCFRDKPLIVDDSIWKGDKREWTDSEDSGCTGCRFAALQRYILVCRRSQIMHKTFLFFSGNELRVSSRSHDSRTTFIILYCLWWKLWGLMCQVLQAPPPPRKTTINQLPWENGCSCSHRKQKGS